MRHLLLSCASFFGLLAAATLLEACTDDDTSGTGGQRVALRTRAEVVANGEAFTNAQGWSVELSEALLSVGSLYYFHGAPAVEASRWPALLGLRTAHAHPGHYQSGDALGQMLEPWAFDVLAGGALPDGDGVTGVYRTGSLVFAAPSAGPAAGELGELVASVRGVANKEGEESRHFRALAGFDEVARSVADAAVAGCPFEEATVGGDGTVTVTFTPEIWFRLVDFALVDAGTEDEPADFAPQTQPRIAFSQGLAQASAYSFAFAP
jgi:hypothetical protein